MWTRESGSDSILDSGQDHSWRGFIPQKEASGASAALARHQRRSRWCVSPFIGSTWTYVNAPVAEPQEEQRRDVWLRLVDERQSHTLVSRLATI